MGETLKPRLSFVIIWCGFHSAAPDWPALTLALIMTALTQGFLSYHRLWIKLLEPNLSSLGEATSKT